MSAVFAEWWRGRAIRAEHDADALAAQLTNLLDSWGPSIAEWLSGRDALIDWAANHGSRKGDGGSGYWSERAMVSEQDADRLAQVLEAIDEHHNLAYVQWHTLRMAISEHLSHRSLRYNALPTGPTLTGNLTSGGVDI